jgi:predicted N-formylglutamate amidohydrolase
VIAGWGNYVIVNPSHWGNYLIADNDRVLGTHKPANQAPTDARRAHQRVRTCSLNPQVNAYSQVLEPHRLAGRAHLVVTSHERDLDHALVEVRRDLIRQIEDERSRREPRKGRKTRYRTT